jgi:hypothetical protein
MNDNEYKPKLTKWNRRIICGEHIEDGQEVVSGKMKRGGTRCAHKACWECEQADLAKEAKK